jgi:hypothetical protein
MEMELMPLVSTRLVPELQYYFNSFVSSSIMNKKLFPIPAPLRIEYFDENRSFIRMLFDDSWSYDEYWYKYIREDAKGSWPLEVQTRLNVYPTSGQYYICSDSTAAINLLVLQADDLLLLDKLCDYRIDPDNTTLVDIDYSLLTTNLSKLIFIYLSLKIDNDYTLYDDTQLISNSGNSLECCYEAYVSENIFTYVSSITVQLE